MESFFILIFFFLTVLAADKVLQLPQEPTLVQADVTLQRILLGQPYFLEQYKSLASKTSLLDAAIKSGDGNAILIVSSTTFERSFSCTFIIIIENNRFF